MTKIKPVKVTSLWGLIKREFDFAFPLLVLGIVVFLVWEVSQGRV